MEFGILGPLVVRTAEGELSVGGAKRRALLALLILNANRVVAAERLIDDLWDGEPPDTASSTLQSHVYNLRRTLGPDRLHTRGSGYLLEVRGGELDAAVFEAELAVGRAALDAGDAATASEALTSALGRWRGRAYDDVSGVSWVTAEAARLEEARAEALESLLDARLAAGAHADVVGRAEAAIAEFPLRERLWRQLMLALYREGRQAEALRAYQRVRTLLGEELGIEPSTELRQLEAAILTQDSSIAGPVLPPPPARGNDQPALPSGVVTFLMTDVVGSTRLWETASAAMPAALQRHDEIMSAAVAAHDGVVLKARGEGDSTFSVFRRASDGAAAAADAQAQIGNEPWPEQCRITVRMALHTGEAFERDGDFFGPALNRAARLRSLAGGNQVLVSQATAELVRDHLPAKVGLRSLGHRELRDLSRGEHVYELVTGEEVSEEAPPSAETRIAQPPLPAPLAASGPFVGREGELDRLSTEWQQAVGGSARAAVLGGEPGVGKTRLAAEFARGVHEGGALVLYGRCDEDLGAPYQPFVEALRTVLPSLGGERLRALRGVEELGRLVPEVADLVPDLNAPFRGEPETERYALFDAVTRLFVSTATDLPVLVVLDDLQWASKPTLLLLRHILRNVESAHVFVVATYRTTDLDPAHPLAATLTDLHRDQTAVRLVLSGLADREVTAYLDAAGYQDEELASALASVTSGNPFFLIEVLRHLDETGGRWDPSTLPQGVREAVGRRLARLSADANDALLAGAVVGGRFALDVVERVVGRDLIDAVSEACDAELVVEEPGGWFRFNHAIVRRSLLAGVPSVKRVRLHQRIAEQLEASARFDDSDTLAELAHHYFESAWAGNAAKAVEYCRRAADQAMSDVAYEAAADLYDRALQAMDIDDRPPDDGERAELLLARCEALLSAGDVGSATEAVARLEEAASGSPRLAAWATCFSGQLAVLTHPDQLDAIEGAVASAAAQLAELDDAAGEAKAYTVRASCLARLGRHADCETALDRALTAARRGGDPRRVNAVLAGAPLAALWGPNPVPRAGGRCLDVIRLLRITTGSPAVEATSTRCQAVLEAFRGRGHAARRMLDNARRSLTDLGLRHALLEVDLFAGIVELVDGDAAAAEIPLGWAYAGFRRMGLDADAAQAAALLARARMDLGRDDEAEELCAESERLSGHDLKAAIAWRAVRAQLHAHHGEHARAHELAQAAVSIAERTDALVDHGDACVALATVLDTSGDGAGARRAADAAAALYERKGAAALVERTRQLFSEPLVAAPTPRERTRRSLSGAVGNLATNAIERYEELWNRRDRDALRALVTDDVVGEDRRSGVLQAYQGADNWIGTVTANGEAPGVVAHEVVATRGDLLGLFRGRWRQSSEVGAPEVAYLLATAVGSDGRIGHHVTFDPDDFDAAFAELDALYLAGEAAPYADVFRAVAGAVAAGGERQVEHMAPGITMVDHRLVPVLYAPDRASLASILGRAFGGLPQIRVRIVAVHRLNERGAVFTVDAEGEWGRPRRSGDALLGVVNDNYVSIIEGGLVARTEIFGAEALDAALARFVELQAGASQAAVTDNLPSRLIGSAFAFALAGEVDKAAGLLAEDCVADDRRTGIRLTTRGRAAMLEDTVRPIRDLGITDIDVNVTATRADRLALARVRFRGRDHIPDDAETEALLLAECSDDSHIVAVVAFDPDAEDAAFAELDARFIAGEGGARAEVFGAMAGGVEAFNLRTREHPSVHPDVVMVDHRQMPIVEMGNLHSYQSRVRASYEDVPDITSRMTAVHILDDAGGVVTIEASGLTRAGAPIEYTRHVVQLVHGRRVTRVEFFSENDLEAALARFAELARPPSLPSLVNDAARGMARLVGAFMSRRWDDVAGMIAPDAVFDDRRSVLSYRAEGRDAYISVLQSLVEAGVIAFDTIPIATRGNRLFLSRVVVRVEGYEAESLSLAEFDSNGRALAGIAFDADDLDAAFAELDARYVAGEGAAHAEVFRAMAGGVEAYNLRRREHPRVHPDLVMVDRQRLSIMTIDGVTSYQASLRSLYENLPDAVARMGAIHALSEAGGVATIVAGGTSQDGTLVEYVVHIVQLVEGGRVTRVETFSDGDLELALARFAELTAPVAPSLLSNAAGRGMARQVEAFLGRRWDDVAELVAPDAVLDDRRPVMTFRYEGRDGWVSFLRSVAEVGVTRFDTIPLATRGDRLLLSRNVVGGEGFEAVSVNVAEVDEDGRAVAGISFDPDDLDAAFAELDARYLAGEGAAHADVFRVMAASVQAWNRPLRDSSVVHPGAVMIDRSRMSFMGGDDTASYRAALRPGFELVPDLGARMVAVHALNDVGGVMTTVATGTSQDGAPVEWMRHVVERVEQGQVIHCEWFSEEDLDQALRCFGDLAGAPHRDNAAVRAGGRWREAFNEQRWDVMGEAVVDDIVHDDRRTGIHQMVHGRPAWTDSIRVSGVEPGSRLDPTVVAIRGDRLALVRLLYRGPDRGPGTPEIEMLVVDESDPEGRLAASVTFDPDDLDAAFAELDGRYLAGEGAPYAETLGPMFDVMATNNARDWDKYQSLLADDPQLVDHRPASLGTIRTAEEASRAFQAMVEVAGGDFRARTLDVLAVEHGAATFAYGFSGTTAAGWALDLGASYSTLAVTNGRIIVFEIFGPDGRDAALARFDELARGPDPLENAATSAIRRRHGSLVAENRSSADLFVEDAVIHDRRRGVRQTLRGREEISAGERAAQHIGMTRIEDDIVAVRGDRLALVKVRGGKFDRSAGAFEGHVLEIVEVDGEGKITLAEVFDEDALDAALAELESRYLDGEASPFAKTWRTIARSMTSINRHEPLPVPDSYEGVDHRPLAMAIGNPRQWASAEDVGDLKIRVTMVVRLAVHGAVLRLNVEETDPEGSTVSWSNVAVITVGEHGRTELFDEHQLEAAISRFEELRPSSPRLENTASQARRRSYALILALDWESLAAQYAHDPVFRDWRSGVLATMRGPAEIVDYHRSVAAMGVTYIDTRVVATRGDRLALTHNVGGGEDRRRRGAYEGAFLDVIEIDGDGLISSYTTFDEEALADAYDELESRYLEGEAAPFAPIWRPVVEATRAINRHDRATVPEIHVVDHSRMWLPPLGSGPMVDALLDLVPDVTMRIPAVHRLDRHAAVFTVDIEGTNEEGAPVSWSFVDVASKSHAEIFRDDQLEAALARFEELRPSSPTLENAASKARRRTFALLLSEHWESLAAQYAHDAVFRDWRSGVFLTRRGTREIVEYFSSVAAMGVSYIDTRVVATRGDRLALTHNVGGGQDRHRTGAYEAAFLDVTEIDGDGLISSCTVFDEDAIDDAYEELEARYLAGDAAPCARVWGRIVDSIAAINHNDAATVRDVEIIDHTQMWLPASGAGSMAEAQLDLVADLTVRIPMVHRLGHHGAVFAILMEGTNDEGGPVTWTLLAVESEGSAELFPDDQLDAALARFEELRRSSPTLENAAIRTLMREWDSIVRRDWETAAETYAVDVMYEDRRRGLHHVAHGRDAVLGLDRVVGDLGVTFLDTEVIALRGDRLALTRTHGGGRSYDAEFLCVTETDAEGRTLARINFDASALDAAFAELEERYLGGEGAPHAETWRRLTANITAFNGGDLSALPSTPLVDHTRQWLPPDDVIHNAQVISDLVARVFIRATAVHRLEDRGAVFSVVQEGSTAEGADLAWSYLVVAHIPPPGDTEIFRDDQLDAALARFEELGGA